MTDKIREQILAVRKTDVYKRQARGKELPEVLRIALEQQASA